MNPNNPCGCTGATTPPELLIVPASSQIVQVPQAYCTEPSPAASAAAATTACPDPLPQTTGPLTSAAVGSQFRFTTACASSHIRPGQLIWFPGQGYVEVVYVQGDNVTVKNISLVENLRLEVGQEFQVMGPLDSALLSKMLCQGACNCDSTRKASALIGCVNGIPGTATCFEDTAFPVATEQDKTDGLQSLVRNQVTGCLRRTDRESVYNPAWWGIQVDERRKGPDESALPSPNVSVTLPALSGPFKRYLVDVRFEFDQYGDDAILWVLRVNGQRVRTSAALTGIGPNLLTPDWIGAGALNSTRSTSTTTSIRGIVNAGTYAFDALRTGGGDDVYAILSVGWQPIG